jgi:hypothetical protein
MAVISSPSFGAKIQQNRRDKNAWPYDVTVETSGGGECCQRFLKAHFIEGGCLSCQGGNRVGDTKGKPVQSPCE